MRLVFLWLAVVGHTAALLFKKSDARRDLRWDGSCSSARVECANKCSGDIATFDCDPSFFGIDDGSYYCTCGALGSARSCFAGSGLVSTPAGEKRIKDVAIGDHILTVNQKGAPAFSPVGTVSIDNFLSCSIYKVVRFCHNHAGLFLQFTEATATSRICQDHYRGK